MYSVDLIPRVSERDRVIRGQRVLFSCISLPFSFDLKLFYHTPVLLHPVEKIDTCFGVTLLGSVY